MPGFFLSCGSRVTADLVKIQGLSPDYKPRQGGTDGAHTRVPVAAATRRRSEAEARSERQLARKQKREPRKRRCLPVGLFVQTRGPSSLTTGPTNCVDLGIRAATKRFHRTEHGRKVQLRSPTVVVGDEKSTWT